MKTLLEAHRHTPAAALESLAGKKRVLNVGSGPYAPEKLHAMFRTKSWKEVRLDIDIEAKPDFVGSITNLSSVFPPASFDALWSSHMIEHLHAHQVVPALVECRHALSPFGFALITCPDVEAIATLVLQHGFDHEVYRSPAGPITPLDMLFGHSPSIAKGNYHMAHKTGFTAARLGNVLLEAGFKTALVRSGQHLDLWALALMSKADTGAIQRDLLTAGLDMMDEAAG